MGFKTMGRWLLGLGLGAIALVGFGGWYLQQRLTQVPPRLETIPSHRNTYERHQALQQKAVAVVKRWKAERPTERKPQASAPTVPRDPNAMTVALSASDLNALLALTLAQGLEGKRASQIVQATQVEFLPQTLKTSALLDLSQVALTDFQGGDRLSLLRRVEQIPGLKDRPIYVAAEGKPVVRDRALSLQDLTLTVGSLRLTLADAAQYLGVSEVILQESLDRELRNLPIDLERVEVIPAASTPGDWSGDNPASPRENRLELTGYFTAW